MAYTRDEALCFLGDFADVRERHDGDGWPWNVATTAYDMLADMVELAVEPQQPRETRWLTTEEYAEMFGVNVQNVRQACREGKMPNAVKPLGRESGIWRIGVPA